MRRRFAVLALLILAVLTVGCGTVVDHVKLEEAIEANLENSVHEKIKAVECPSDLSVDPGATFTCVVIFVDGRREEATLKIRNKDADISMIGLEPEN